MAKIKQSAEVSQVSTLPKAKTRAVSSVGSLTEDERRSMIAEAAYYLAEKRGFAGGDPGDDWLQAEAQINQMTGMAGPMDTVTH